MTWNVQRFAGKNYVFFFDTQHWDGPDNSIKLEDMNTNLLEVVIIIKEENPDFILLQELQDHSRFSQYQDQLKRLLDLLPKEYCSYAVAYDGRLRINLHPRLLSPTYEKMVIISKYQIHRAIRYQLPKLFKSFILSNIFYKRALLEGKFKVQNGKDFSIINTHYEAFAKGKDTLRQQVIKASKVLDDLSKNNHAWVFGGDLNLLPTEKAYRLLQDDQKYAYNNKTELAYLYKRYYAVPRLTDVNGKNRHKWFTFFTNDPKVTKIDRTLDYFFYSKDIKLINSYVRSHDTLKISDHLPLIIEVQLS